MFKILRITTLLFAVLFTNALSAKTVRALFIGNSYIYTNDLPGMLKEFALTTGDTLIYESSAPGGTSLQQHTTNATTLSLIARGNWNYVILQEQSQMPSFPESQVVAQVYPFARTLDSMIHRYNSCTRTVFYMTWGRKNGDASNCGGWPPVCTYLGMDSLLQLRYSTMAIANNAWLVPVAKVWRRLRANSSMELYNPDESHPSVNGTYAAAAAFYAVLFQKDPTAVSYTASLSSADAATIKTAAKSAVYDSLSYWTRFTPPARANFNTTINGRTVSFANLSILATDFYWSFGDGTTATVANPAHTYSAYGIYNVLLKANNSCDTVSVQKAVSIGNVGIETAASQFGIACYPNPSKEVLHIDTKVTGVQFDLHDAMGREVLSGVLANSKNELNLRAISSGNYFMLLRHEGQIIYRKMICVQKG